MGLWICSWKGGTRREILVFIYSGSSDFLSTILRFSFHIKIWSKVKLKGKKKKKSWAENSRVEMKLVGLIERALCAITSFI
jgi:hypothetical protein